MAFGKVLQDVKILPHLPYFFWLIRRWLKNLCWGLWGVFIYLGSEYYRQAGAELCQAQMSWSYLLPTYFLAYLLTELLTYLVAYLLDCYLPCFLRCLVTCLLGCLLVSLHVPWVTWLLLGLLTCLLTSLPSRYLVFLHLQNVFSKVEPLLIFEFVCIIEVIVIFWGKLLFFCCLLLQLYKIAKLTHSSNSTSVELSWSFNKVIQLPTRLFNLEYGSHQKKKCAKKWKKAVDFLTRPSPWIM